MSLRPQGSNPKTPVFASFHFVSLAAAYRKYSAISTTESGLGLSQTQVILGRSLSNAL
ncbi:MAG: hypothetical protein MET45_02935 [Nostoc sp. LLA-1]|nr:hypothetical protein [Cyanocohniella sp. LLY]